MSWGVSFFFFFSSRRRHTRCSRDWSSDVCSSDLLKLTIARYLTPSGRSIQERGITPDVWVEQLKADQLKAAVADPDRHVQREQELPRHLKGEAQAAGGGKGAPNPALATDFQLRTAV